MTPTGCPKSRLTGQCYRLTAPELVRKGGLEPPRPCGHWHLKPARLPIPPLARAWMWRAHPERQLEQANMSRGAPELARRVVRAMRDPLGSLSQVEADEFLEKIQRVAEGCGDHLVADDGSWVVKGFIDLARNIYVMPGDTKVVSKLVELMLLPTFADFAQENGFRLVLPKEQNHYPDLTFIDDDGHAFAVDLKTTYRISPTRVNTMTLGAFTGYFRMRESRKNTTLPYGSYKAHIVFGVLYTRVTEALPEEQRFQLESLASMPSVIRDLVFFAQPKYRIASALPGSGNTKNIGAVTTIDAVINGRGPFAELGEEVFDAYWMNYLTRDMARAVELPRPPYTNLATYTLYRESL